MPDYDRTPWVETLVGIALLIPLAVFAYAVLMIVLGTFGIDLPVPDWLWELTGYDT